MTCPVCGDLYAVHFEHVYSCPQGHTWTTDDLRPRHPVSQYQDDQGNWRQR